MSLIPTTSEGVTKMKLIAYEDVAFNSAIAGAEIELQINPENLKVSYEITPPESTGTDSNAITTGDSTYTTPTLEIGDIVVDATGVLFNEIKGDAGGKTVNDFIKLLKKVVYNYVDGTHGPPYVKIQWGSVVIESTNLSSGNVAMFKGQLKSMNIEYSLFSRKGEPIRAKITLAFNAMTDPAFRPTGQSPDLTHVHQLQMGDNLSALSRKIYNTPNFYMQLAKVNGLSSIYQLKPGVELVIPPLDKASR